MEETKRQDLPSGLWVIATPIGNLEDLSPRARRALELADGILCEDTRQTAKLLAALGFARVLPRLSRLDAHAGERELAQAAERLVRGESLALVSDAGTPAVSDPGARLVALARERGVRVVPVPGPSAVMALLSVSGFEETGFVFRGFFPRKAAERVKELEIARISETARVFVWFESPQRIREILALVRERTPEAQVVAAKELTKFHERVFCGTALEVEAAVASELDQEGERGEWCFSLCFPARSESSQEVSSTASANWDRALRCLLEAGISPSVAAKQISHHFEIAKRTVYDRAIVLSAKKSFEGG